MTEDFEKELQKCKANPNHYICEWMESNALHVGRKVFKLLALQPCSLILPDIAFGSRKIRSNFNILYLSNPSSGKSTIAKKYAEIITLDGEDQPFNPYIVRKVSAYQLTMDMASKRIFTLITEDFSQLVDGADKDETIKTIEGALGDEKRILKKNNNMDIDVKVEAVGLFAGTWNDLSKYINSFKSGMFFRFVMLFVDLTEEQSSEIGRYIMNGVGNKEMSDLLVLKEKVIRKFYTELADIQAGLNPEIPQIRDYHIPDKIKAEIFELWDKCIRTFNQKNKDKIEYSFNRELEESLRFLCANALLNIFHRKVIEGVLQITEEDAKIAKELMLMNLENKLEILQSERYLRDFGVKGLRRALESNISEKKKKILMNLAIK